MKRRSIVITAVLVLMQFCCGEVWAQPTTAYQAERIVAGWLKADARPLGAALGQQVAKVETFTNDGGEPIYYIVYLEPSGFVIVPADDLVEPIIGFVEKGTYDPSPENPLGALVTNDLKGRIEAVRDLQRLQASAVMESAVKSQDKWGRLEGLVGQLLSDSNGLLDINDVRVAPLVQTKWGQKFSLVGNACYNYYTPLSDPCDPCDYSDPCQYTGVPRTYGDPNNYPSGCVATAMAQLMCFHKYPNEPNGVGKRPWRWITVNGTSEKAWMRGSDGLGGPYEWNLMVNEPNWLTTASELQAIGALCYDAGVSVDMNYTPTGSSAWLIDAAIALRNVNVFNYSNAVCGSNTLTMGDIGGGLNGMVNPNLDYGHPVILGIAKTTGGDQGGGHAVVADGYGYELSTLYHHFNMGWEGNSDAWYNLPNVGIYTIVKRCVYNVFTSGDGEIISGRVTDTSGNPINGATLRVEGPGGPYNLVTNTKGIYALGKVPSVSNYTVSVMETGYQFTSRAVTTGNSVDANEVSGNLWGVDFVGSSAWKVLASDGVAWDLFGNSVSVFANTAVIGAEEDDVNGTDSGSAYVFSYDGSSWLKEQKLLASDGNNGDHFGRSVGISGEAAVIGAEYDDANGEDSGSAYVFRYDGSSWVEEQQLLASDGSMWDYFGCSVAISGEVAVVGAYADDDNGASSGSAYVFRYNEPNWVEEQKLLPSDGSNDCYFGCSVAVSGDVVVVGARNDPQVGSDPCGTAYVFRYNSSSWVEEQKLLASGGNVGDRFGYSVAVSGDVAVIGADEHDDSGADSGSAYVFDYNGVSWSEEQKLLASDGNNGHYFGGSVSISGEVIVVGARGKDDCGANSGSAYVFRDDASSWVEERKLLAWDCTAQKYFGYSVAICGEAIVVGAEWDDDNGAGSGSAYIFGFNRMPGDLDGDCYVDYSDADLITRDWLMSGGVVAATTPEVNAVVQYKFDEGSGSTTAYNSGDLAGYHLNFPGAPNNPSWVSPGAPPDACDPNSALYFDGVGDYLAIPALNLNSNTVTMSAWIKRDGEQGMSYTGILFSRAGNSIAGLSFGGTAGPYWQINNEAGYNWNGSPNAWGFHSNMIIPDDKWVFVAVAVEPTQATLYLAEPNDSPPYDYYLRSATNILVHDTEEFDGVTYIGYDWWANRYFKGTIDDVHIYNYTLSPAEVADVAGISDVYVPLEAWRADLNGDGTVDLKDYAIMASNWLNELPWP